MLCHVSMYVLMQMASCEPSMYSLRNGKPYSRNCRGMGLWREMAAISGETMFGDDGLYICVSLGPESSMLPSHDEPRCFGVDTGRMRLVKGDKNDRAI